MDTLLRNNTLDIKKSISYFKPGKHGAGRSFSQQLLFHFKELNASSRDIVIICIGSDKATGDCLGPLVGDKLTRERIPYYVYGTLDTPVHAGNLPETLDIIHRTHINPFIIAIDASLGTSRHVGYVTLGKGSLKPGIGVNKELPNVGDLYITGIVNVSGMINHMLIQTTRLHLVMQLADFIFNGLHEATISISYDKQHR